MVLGGGAAPGAGCSLLRPPWQPHPAHSAPPYRRRPRLAPARAVAAWQRGSVRTTSAGAVASNNDE